MSIDLSNYSLNELETLQKEIEKQKKIEAEKPVTEAVAQALAILREAGAKVNESDLRAFFGGTARRVRKSAGGGQDPSTATHYNPDLDKPKKWFNINSPGAKPVWFRDATPAQQAGWEISKAERDQLIADGKIK